MVVSYADKEECASGKAHNGSFVMVKNCLEGDKKPADSSA